MFQSHVGVKSCLADAHGMIAEEFHKQAHYGLRCKQNLSRLAALFAGLNALARALHHAMRLHMIHMSLRANHTVSRQKRTMRVTSQLGMHETTDERRACDQYGVDTTQHGDADSAADAYARAVGTSSVGLHI